MKEIETDINSIADENQLLGLKTLIQAEDFQMPGRLYGVPICFCFKAGITVTGLRFEIWMLGLGL